jgi:hypothetical protein
MFKYYYFNLQQIVEVIKNNKKIPENTVSILNIADVLFLKEYSHKKFLTDNIYEKFDNKIGSSNSFIIPELSQDQLLESLFVEDDDDGLIIDKNINRKTTPRFSLGYLTLKETFLTEHFLNEDLIRTIHLHLSEYKSLGR